MIVLVYSPKQRKNVDQNFNRFLLTDITGAFDEPLNIANLAKAIASFGGKHTTICKSL
ncbi:MAG: hypothetical protein V7K40_31440 [Nostoc sp.]|uniref:hypothetical protein n=1 Tax=Nostoc sp. TaxID=1180 RepID=UPI002FFBC06A